jgi:uncharacterized protein
MNPQAYGSIASYPKVRYAQSTWSTAFSSQQGCVRHTPRDVLRSEGSGQSFRAGVRLLVLALAFRALGCSQTFEDAITAAKAGKKELAFTTLLTLAEKEDGRAQVAVGMMYEEGLGVPKDAPKALAWYRRAATHGNAEGMFRVAAFELVPGKEGIVLLEEAALKGHLGAQMRLAGLHGLDLVRTKAPGSPFAPDYAQVCKWYGVAAARGNAKAQYEVGRCYAEGKGVSKDERKAAELFELAVKQEHLEAHWELAGLFLGGSEVERNPQRAAALLTVSASRDHIPSQAMLGIMFRVGQGVLQDYNYAFKWLTKAAAMLDETAMGQLGLMYFNDEGVPRDFVKAHMYINLAASTSESNAGEWASMRDKTARKMKPEQVRIAQAAAKHFKERADRAWRDELQKRSSTISKSATETVSPTK